MKATFVVLSIAVAIALSAALAQVQSTPNISTKPKPKMTAKLVTSAASGAITPYSQIDFNWSYIGNLPACAGSLTACYDGFVLANTTTNQTIANATSIGPTALSYNWIPRGGVPYGTFTFSLAAHGYDEGGNVLLSNPATVVVSVKVTTLNGPTGLTGKLQ